MRISAFSIGLLALLTPLASAWTKEDREIFRVRDELATYEGPDVTFYDFLGVPPSASLDEINKAYRKKSRSLHPDKVKQQLAADRARAKKASGSGSKNNNNKKKPGVHVSKPPSAAEVRAAVKRASERQARLSIVANILRGPGRDRYDHFLANGFPAWKGTGYYYSRYRPGLGTAVAGVFLVAGGAAHYLALYMGWRRRREFVERYIRFARHAAWGENLGIPGLDVPAQPELPQPQQQQGLEDEPGRAVAVNRKMRRMQERDARKEAAKDAQGGRRARKAAAAGSGRASGSATPQPRPQGSGGGPTGAKKRVVAENGKVLVVDSLGDVYLEQEDEDGHVEEYLLDPNEIACPTIKDTALVRLPVWAYRATVSRLFPNRGTDAADQEEAEQHQTLADADDEEEDSEPGKRTPSTTDSAEGFELLEKAGDDEQGGARDVAKATGSSGGAKQVKAAKRKGKKR